MTKSGSGALSIAGANPFIGAFTIGQGTLALNGAFGGDVTIGSQGTLRGARSPGRSTSTAA